MFSGDYQNQTLVPARSRNISRAPVAGPRNTSMSLSRVGPDIEYAVVHMSRVSRNCERSLWMDSCRTLVAVTHVNSALKCSMKITERTTDLSDCCLSARFGVSSIVQSALTWSDTWLVFPFFFGPQLLSSFITDIPTDTQIYRHTETTCRQTVPSVYVTGSSGYLGTTRRVFVVELGPARCWHLRSGVWRICWDPPLGFCGRALGRLPDDAINKRA